jgi:predicted kinase
MNKVRILRGISGSGKSTYTRANYPNAFVVSADHYFIKDGIYTFDVAQLGTAHSTCFRKYIEALQDELPLVVVDNTNTTAWECSPYVQGAAAFGYESEIITLDCEPDVAAKRNVHGVPRKNVLDMYRRLIKNKLPPFWNQRMAK